MSTTTLTPTQRDQQRLLAFLDPLARAAGVTLRPFGLNAWNRVGLLGIPIFSEGFAALEQRQKDMALQALLVLQSCPLDDAKKWTRQYMDQWEKFYWDVCLDYFPEDQEMGIIELAAEQVAQTGPAIEASQVDLVESEALKQKGEKPPPNA